MPGSGAVGVDPEIRKVGKEQMLTPTQSVVVALLTLLPETSYHVYLDNLFSSPALYKRLRDFRIAASGTCCMKCGIHEDIVGLKKKPGDMPYLGPNSYRGRSSKLPGHYI